ncbi:hypothetical protein PMI29_05301 [Pseudomonas sp. GM49]|nr:hypothetical protein PMI29_05301 [Pseudomonas sp. GM49]
MPDPLRMDPRRFPLHVHISVMFTFLLLLTGVVPGLFNYRQTTQIILSSSENSSTALSRMSAWTCTPPMNPFVIC